MFGLVSYTFNVSFICTVIWYLILINHKTGCTVPLFPLFHLCTYYKVDWRNLVFFFLYFGHVLLFFYSIHSKWYGKFPIPLWMYVISAGRLFYLGLVIKEHMKISSLMATMWIILPNKPTGYLGEFYDKMTSDWRGTWECTKRKSLSRLSKSLLCITYAKRDVGLRLVYKVIWEPMATRFNVEESFLL